jgi:hypothetical protein
MGKSNVIETEGRAGRADPLTELLRTSASIRSPFCSSKATGPAAGMAGR